MKYIWYNKTDGTILGLETVPTNNYYTLSDEAYTFILQHNGEYYVLVDKAEERIKNNEEVIITLNELSNERKYDISVIIDNMKTKNYDYCKMYIEDGIIYNNKHYTYKLEDQVNYEQIIKLIKNNILLEVPIKASGETEYTYITINEFKDLYKKLLKNKFYQLFYLQSLNHYIETLDEEVVLHRLNYETALPSEYITEINNKLSNFEEGDIL